MYFVKPQHLQTVFYLTVLILSILWLVIMQPAHAADAAYNFMRTVTDRMQTVQRKPGFSERADGFANIVSNYAHLGKIGNKALGSYRHKLKKRDRSKYYSGMASWIGFYVAGEAAKFPVEKVLLAPNAIREGHYHLVDSKIKLEDGKVYNVRWFLMPHRKSFKVVEIQVDIGLGLTDVTPYLRDIFVRHIEENDNSVEDLVVTLAKFKR